MKSVLRTNSKAVILVATSLTLFSLSPGALSADKAPSAKPAATPAVKPATPPAPTGAPGSNKSINIDTLPNDMVICTVGGDTIKVGDYRRTMKFQQMNLQKQIIADPGVQMQLLAQAKQRGIQLSAAEKTKLLAQARQESTKNGKSFKDFLKEKNVTEAQYNEQIEGLGLVYKMAEMTLQEGVLPDLVNRQLLIRAARKQGLEKDAMSKYFNLKNSPHWEELKKETGLPADVLRDEVVNSDLAQMEMDKIKSGSRVTESEIQSVYNANKAQFKHGERIRLGSILIPAPQEDNGPVLSVKTQIKNAFPKLTAKEVDAKAAEYMQTAQQKALIVLAQAKAPGVDFAKLADQNSDPVNKGKGGDLGWQEKKELVPQFADAVWNLKKGDVLPKLVRTALGYQIIKVTDHQKAGTMTLSEVRNLVQAKIAQAKLQGALNNWLSAQKQQVKVEFSPRFMAVANGNGTAIK